MPAPAPASLPHTATDRESAKKKNEKKVEEYGNHTRKTSVRQPKHKADQVRPIFTYAFIVFGVFILFMPRLMGACVAASCSIIVIIFHRKCSSLCCVAIVGLLCVVVVHEEKHVSS
jgi:hypothetical protein